MFAAKRRVGARGSWCATQAMIHSFSCASPLSFLDSVPGAVASGQVWTMARSMQRAGISHQRARGGVMERLDYVIATGRGRMGPSDPGERADSWANSYP